MLNEAVEPPVRDKVVGYVDHLRLLWAAAPVWSTVCLIATVVSAGTGTLNMIALGQMVAGLNEVVGGVGSADRLWTWFVIFTMAALTGQIANGVVGWGGSRCSAAYRVRLDELIAEIGLHSRDLGWLQQEEFGGRLESLAGNSRGWLLRDGLTGTWEFVALKLTACGAAVVLVSWRWWVPIVIIGCYLGSSVVMRRYIDHLMENLFEKVSEDRRRADYAGRLMTLPGPAKEIRLFGLAPWLLHRYESFWHAAQEPIWRESKTKLIPPALVLAAQALIVGGALVLLGHDVLVGTISAAAVTTMVVAILGLRDFGPLGDIETGLIRTASFVRNLFAFRESMGLPSTALLPAAPAARRGGGAIGIEITDLTFSYPSRDKPTLCGLSLSVPPGQSLAIVGVNGAGKSTLIKLLAGLYRPESGTVRVGGKDPFDDESSHGEIAVVFQDFIHYPLSLRDNVSFGSMGRGGDQQLLDKALADAAGAELLQRLGGNWDTILSNEFEGGTELSGGQWQRVALARALAAIGSGAGLLVLDEPTAALDVRAEAEIFDRFLDAAQGVTTVLVSHRLSTVRRAERIVVLDGNSGRITEDGSHEELMVLGGAYAEMFTLQASRFAAAGGKTS